MAVPTDGLPLPTTATAKTQFALLLLPDHGSLPLPSTHRTGTKSIVMWRPTKKQSAGLVAVAVDDDKSSQHALKWAADHLLSKGQIFHLLHVRKKISALPSPVGQPLSLSEVDEDVAATYLHQLDAQTKEILLPFQCFCSRRGLYCKEVILDEADVSKAIVNYITFQSIDKLVLGASSRNAFTRTFKADVPTSVSKVAPDFCSIYIINSKGKIASVRSALHPNKNSVDRPSVFKSEATRNPYQSAKSDPAATQSHEILSRSGSSSTPKSGGGHGQGLGSHPGHSDYSYQSVSSCPSPTRNNMNQAPYNYAMHERLEGGKRLPKMNNVADGGMHRSDERSIEVHRTGFYNMLSSAGDDAYEYDGLQHSSTSGESMSSYSSPTRSIVNHTNDYFMHGRLNGGRRLPRMNSAFDEDHFNEPRRFDIHKSDFSSISSTSGGDSYELIYDLQHSSAISQEEELNDQLRKLRLQANQARNMYNDFVDAVNATTKVRDSHVHLPGEQRNGKLGGAEKEELDPRVSDGAYKTLSDVHMKVFNAFSSNIKYRRFTAAEIVRATDNFSDALKIGEGGYGPVFKSTINQSIVAIKVLHSNVTQGLKQFQQEVEVLSTIRHPNMVLLMGACPEYGCLVYEYMSNGSLEDRLFRLNNTPPLSWQLRFKIAAEIATCLLFLHRNKPEPLVHRDLKPGNILLDHNFVSKIADVGLARLIPPAAADAVTQYRMTAAAGTFCYIDPEYQKSGMLGIKSDIYALGIILLQLIAAKPPMGLAHTMESAMESGDIKGMLDPSVKDWPTEETVKFVKLALKCAELRRKDRPDLATVVLPELNHLRKFAEEALPSLKHFQHVNSWHHQEVYVSSGPNSTSTSDLETAYPASLMAPTLANSSILA